MPVQFLALTFQQMVWYIQGLCQIAKNAFSAKVCFLNVISMTKMYSETTPQNSNFEEKNPMILGVNKYG